VWAIAGGILPVFMTILLPAMLLISNAPFLFGGAKPVPVAFHRLRHPWRDMMLVSLAGPGSNLLIAVFLYVLLAPRPMAYGYLMLGAGPFMAAPRPFDTRAGRWILAAALAAQGVLRALHLPARGAFADQAPFLFALAFWLLVLRQSRARAGIVRPASIPSAGAGR